MDEIAKLEKRYAYAQKAYEDLADGYKQAIEQNYADLKPMVAERKAIADSLRVELEAAVLYHYRDNPESKAITDYTKIRDKKIVTYDNDEALAWALDHKLCLAIDEKAYIKQVINGQAPGIVREQPTVTVSSKLIRQVAK